MTKPYDPVAEFDDGRDLDEFDFEDRMTIIEALANRPDDRGTAAQPGPIGSTPESRMASRVDRNLARQTRTPDEEESEE